MRHSFFLLIAMLTSLIGKAQTDSCYFLSKEGASIQYSYKYGGKLMCYIVTAVNSRQDDGGKSTISLLWTMLNKKEKPSKSASMMGMGDGMLTKIQVEDGSYLMAQDMGLAAGGENRHGYILKIPKTLKVGDAIEGSTLNFEHKFMGRTIKNELTYKDFKVVDEVDLTTPADTFHCLKVTGNVSGKFQTMDINDNQVWYIAPGMGIVREELYYLGEKKPIVLEAYKVSGL